MDLPDCPPGAEGYEDTVVEMPKKPGQDDGECTKAEQEFQEHLNSLKIKVDNGETRCMVERHGRDVAGKWIYLCFPCAAVCSGETILQTHISGKKHKTKLSMNKVWPLSIFKEHPHILSQKGNQKEKAKNDAAPERFGNKLAEDMNANQQNSNVTELDRKYDSYRNIACHIQESLDSIKAPLVGLEYLVEHPPEESHHEPSYMCTLCHKQGHPRTIINHLTCFWHRFNYLTWHYGKAVSLLAPYRAVAQYREGVNVLINRLAQRIEDKYGRLKPVHIDKEEYEKDKDLIHQWIYKGYHFSEKNGPTFEEVVDIGLLESLHKSNPDKRFDRDRLRDPSPPIVAAPTKPLFNNYTRPAGRQERHTSVDALSDISDEPDPRRRDILVARPQAPSQRYEPYRGRQESPQRTHRFTNKTKTAAEKDKLKPANFEYKKKLAAEQQHAAAEALKKTLAYHEKNPEKHPLYPDEWKKFWNRRYKEIQSEGKDPSKHDFKPEWIKYWTARMKELHEQELNVQISEIYRKMCLPLPEDEAKPADPARLSPERRRSPDLRRRSPELRRRSPELRRRSPDLRRRSPDLRRRSPDLRRRSPIPRRRSPLDMRRRSPDPRRRSPGPRRRTPDRRRSPLPFADRFRWRKDDDRSGRDHRSPGHRGISETRSQSHRGVDRLRSRSPVHSRTRSPARPLIELEHARRSRSPLSRRDTAAPLRNRSPARPPGAPAAAPADLAPSMQTVLISDDELKPDDGISPWNSDNDSLGSLPDAASPGVGSGVGSRAGSESLRAPRRRTRRRPRRGPPDHAPHDAAEPADLGPPENVVATLRMLVALEDYLGSLGPKIVDLLTEALKMEKERANSSEELLERESALVLVETAKEKLKGAAQAGLVRAAAAPALRAAVVRAAATLHAADTRARQKAGRSGEAPAASAVPVAGVGEVDRAQIAAQMAAALVAQGKTDVSSEELAQLVDAVVGMAEAKKREAEVKKKVEARAASRPARPSPSPAQGKTASALQMLQSAYDENEKRIEKEDAPDAMDGLSDSDLETLLKNFNELSAEEQHSLIAYLKKLEAREPQRVEKLRQYVSAAAAPAPPPAASAPAAPPGAPDVEPVAIDSDDDDYTVEEVFQSATQKVKEDQIRQEMEIVKKSLEESTKTVTPAPEAAVVDSTQHSSSATDLFSLVQASLKNTAAKPTEVVTSHTQPRSFGDLPEAPMAQEPISTTAAPPTLQTDHPVEQVRPQQDLLTAFLNQIPSTRSAETNMGAGREPMFQDRNSPMQNRGPYNQDGRAPYNQDNSGAFSQDSRGSFDQDNNRGPYNQDINRGPFNQDKNMGSFNQDRGPFNQDNNRGPFNQDNTRGNLGQLNMGSYNPDNREPFNQDNRGPYNQDNNNRGGSFNQDNRGPYNQDNRGGSFNQDNRGPFNQGNRGPLLSDNRTPFNQDNRGPLIQDNRVPFNQENRATMPPLIQDMPGAGRQNNTSFPMQNNRGPQMQDNRGGFMQGNRSGPGFNNLNQDNANQFNRGNNFMNGRQDQQQQYGNFDQQKNFRGGRGRGNFGGRMRGRGRGNFY